MAKKHTDIKRIENETRALLDAVENRDIESMARRFEELEKAYEEEFGDKIGAPELFPVFCRMQYAFLKYLTFGNFYTKAHDLADETLDRIDRFMVQQGIRENIKHEITDIRRNIENCIKGVKPRHENLTVGRRDSRCCLCRKRIANKTGSHMVPNFLSHPSFAVDDKGKRFKEALDHHFINRPDRNCSFYGRAVPPERIEAGLGHAIPEDYAENNINQLEFDNEFCSVCEDRWGVLESAYSPYYSGKARSVHPRLSYLFWLSVLYRMSLGSMGLFMRIEDELSLRRLLDIAIDGTAADIAAADTTLGDWHYALYRAQGLRDNGDKGIFGSYMEYPYVIMANDIIAVFYNGNPSDDELHAGPITISRNDLNTWHTPEKTVTVDRRFFWNVRDWEVEVHTRSYDPPTEAALITIREEERHSDTPLSDEAKDILIKVSRLSHPNFDVPVRFRKLNRFAIALKRKKEAEAKGLTYNILEDEEVFLSEHNVQDYYNDLSEAARCGMDVSAFPFYEEARAAIPDKTKWTKCKEADLPNQDKYEETMRWYLEDVLDAKGRRDHFRRMGVPIPEPAVSYKTGRNDPCPCGSGKKYKKCCGR